MKTLRPACLKPDSSIHEPWTVDKLVSEVQFSPLLNGDDNKAYLKGPIRKLEGVIMYIE